MCYQGTGIIGEEYGTQLLLIVILFHFLRRGAGVIMWLSFLWLSNYETKSSERKKQSVYLINCYWITEYVTKNELENYVVGYNIVKIFGNNILCMVISGTGDKLCKYGINFIVHQML